MTTESGQYVGGDGGDLKADEDHHQLDGGGHQGHADDAEQDQGVVLSGADALHGHVFERGENDHRRDRDYEKSEKDAETVHANDVGEGEARRLRHVPGGEQRAERSYEADVTQRFLTVLFVHQRVEHHYQNAEEGEDDLGQDAHVINGLRNGLQLRKEEGHCTTTLLTT